MWAQLALALVIGVTWTVQRPEKPCFCGEQQVLPAPWPCGPLTRPSWGPLCPGPLDHL